MGELNPCCKHSQNTSNLKTNNIIFLNTYRYYKKDLSERTTCHSPARSAATIGHFLPQTVAYAKRYRRVKLAIGLKTSREGRRKPDSLPKKRSQPSIICGLSTSRGTMSAEFFQNILGRVFYVQQHGTECTVA